MICGDTVAVLDVLATCMMIPLLPMTRTVSGLSLKWLQSTGGYAFNADTELKGRLIDEVE